MSNFQQVVSKVLSDAAFRRSLLQDPAATLKREGVKPTPEILAVFKDADDASLQALAKNFGKDKAAV